MAAETVGPYRLIRQISASKGSVLHEARQEGLGRQVLLRCFVPPETKQSEFAARLIAEACIANNIDHPGIAHICDHGQLPDGTVYLVSEVGHSETLAQRVKSNKGPFPFETALYLCRQIAGALSAAHLSGLVHRDLRPDSILLVKDPDVPGGERIKLIGFGITNFAQRWHATQVEAKCNLVAITGNPLYMSPEQCGGYAMVDDKTDVYSLGVILYQMLAGRPPFSGEGPGELIGQHLYKPPPPLAQTLPGIPDAVSAFIDILLVKDRQERPKMEQVQRTLDRLGAARSTENPLLKSGRRIPDSIDPMARTGRFSHSLAGLRSLINGPKGPLQKWLLPAAIAGIVMLIAAALLLRFPHKTKSPSPQTAQRPALPAPISDLPHPAVQAKAQPDMTHAVVPSRAEAAKEPPLPAPQPAPSIFWKLSSIPDDAAVLRASDGLLLGHTPWQIEQPAAPGIQSFVLRKTGYKDARVLLDSGQDAAQELILKPLVEHPAAARPSKAAAPKPAKPQPARPRQKTKTSAIPYET